MNALRDIPLLEGFVRESLRLHPPLNVLSRRVLKPFAYKDYIVDVGKNVMLCPHVAHKLPEYFPNPELFDPRRAPPENVFASIAFGGGKHKCIGNAFALLQVRAIFCALLRDYDFARATHAGCAIKGGCAERWAGFASRSIRGSARAIRCASPRRRKSSGWSTARLPIRWSR
jgi:cytochrome P450